MGTLEKNPLMAKESGHLFFKKKIMGYSNFKVNKENKARVAMECGSWGFKCYPAGLAWQG